MLTLARNLALGRGMSSAEGLIPTNGTQPLATFLWAGVFWLQGGDKVASVRWILALQLLFALATAWGIFRLALRLLGDLPNAKAQALLAASVWYASPTLIPHSMNCLETGLYGLTLVLALSLLLRAPGLDSGRLAWTHWCLAGLLLGLAFWARNDAVLVCGALAIVHLWWGMPGAPKPLSARCLQLAMCGGVVVLVAAPWLLFNYLGFGHLVPISGQAEALDAGFGSNLTQLFPSLFEHLTLLLPLPASMEDRPAVVVGTALVDGGLVGFAWFGAKQLAASRRTALRLALCMLLTYAGFYGLFFGAPYFVSRYLFALSPLASIAWAAVVYRGLLWLSENGKQFVIGRSLAIVWIACTGVLGLKYKDGVNHQHFQVVDWVQRHVAETTWIGAIQTGTLGYFHDRTINLDGKVNPLALEARKQRRAPEYIAKSGIQYLVDWHGLADLMQNPAVSTNFELTVADPVTNLVVLKRKLPPVDVADVLVE